MNDVNFQKVMDRELSEEGTAQKTLLLHACCAPCSSYCLTYLQDKIKLKVLYYNPNIVDLEEYEKRKEELQRLIDILCKEYPDASIESVSCEHESEQFLLAAKGLEKEPEGGKRCEKCFELRLREAAVRAKAEKCDFFTTTLTISPLKNAKLINEIGERIGNEVGIAWLPSDFKKKEGYKQSVELSKKYDLYRQNFCGCPFSQVNGEKDKMKKILDIISDEVMGAFEAAGYEKNAGKVNISNRPDLCEYQCNGAMALAKQQHCAPIQIANAVVEKLAGSGVFSKAEAVMPGFINLNVKNEFIADYVAKMAESDKFGFECPEKKMIIVDYGGPNIAKALHVGHLRPAIIGESVKRILKYAGNDVIGDVHMGDWGTPMGLVMTEIQTRQPDLPYFDENYTGEYPKEAPFTVRDLEEIYPTASAKSKEDPEFKARALEATLKLQTGVRGYRALWDHIINVSVTDMKRIYDILNVNFDLWNGESTVQYRIADMVKYLKDEGYAYESDGALVVDVKEPTDTKEVPPCIILKSDGASLYNTTDLATISERVEKYNPQHMIYITDKRQDLYFMQVFRCAKKTKLCGDDVVLSHIGFGTMNGKDGKPFKTRDGGVKPLESLIQDIVDKMYEKIVDNKDISEEEARNTAKIVGLSALLYGDLSNQAMKDYIFDIDRFTSFEGNTGPYILYTIVRIKSILEKYAAMGGNVAACNIGAPRNESEKNLMMSLTGFSQMISSAAEELAPHRVCAYIYDLANALNSFYHENKILAEEDQKVQSEYIALINLTKRVLEDCIDMLGFEAPERM